VSRRHTSRVIRLGSRLRRLAGRRNAQAEAAITGRADPDLRPGRVEAAAAGDAEQRSSC